MKSNNIKIPKIECLGTIIYTSIDGEFAGYIIISDELKEDSKKAISSLNKIGIKTIMLTGDNKNTAEMISQELGISDFIQSSSLKKKFNK